MIFTSNVWTFEGTWTLVGILSGDLLWFALYTCLYGGVVGYEQIVNTGPLCTVNVVLTSIDRGVPRPVLRFCSRVFPLEVSVNSTLNAGGWLLLMESWTAQAQKGRTPATPPFTLYPFDVQTWEKSKILHLKPMKKCKGARVLKS